jgi:hypothetical protein
MTSIAKRVIAAATRSDTYWNLSDAEKLIWVIEEAYRIGLQARMRTRAPKVPEYPRRSERRPRNFSGTWCGPLSWGYAGGTNRQRRGTLP